MSFAGITRVSDQMRTNTLLTNIRRNNLKLGGIQHQLATGSRLLSPSEDPPAANSILTLERMLAQQQQLMANLDKVKELYLRADDGLVDAATSLVEAQDIASANIGTAATEDQQKAASQMVNELAQHILSIANTRVGDVYLYAGTASTGVPFVSENGGIRYAGSEQGTTALLGEQTPTEIGLTGQDTFGALSSEVAGYRDLSPRMTVNTRLADLTGAAGEGIRLNTIVIQDGTNAIAVDLAGADRVGDVLDKINDAGGGVITAMIGADGKSMRLFSVAPGANLTVTESGAGRAAHDLGIYRPTPQGNWFDGDSVRPQVTVTTRLTDLAGGSGLDLTSGLVITNGGASETVSFSTAVTVGDMLNRINMTDLGISARINSDATGIDVVNSLSGAEMRIGENGGTTADDLGLRSLRADTTLESLNDARGVRRIDGQTDLLVTARDGSSFEVDVSPAVTVQDVVDLINAAAVAAGVVVTGSLASVGNGIELTDASGGAGDLVVSAVNASETAADLGLAGNVSANTLTGQDVNPIVPDGVFAHLAQLRDAVLAGDDFEITRMAQKVKADADRLVGLSAHFGALHNGLDDRWDRTDTQHTADTAMLSELKDTDFTEAISRFQALQVALEANLITASQMLGMSLLDFLR